MAVRRRLDAEMVRRGLAPSRAAAVEMIELGRVLVSGAVAERATRQVSPAEPVVVAGEPERFVGRGARKLEAALERFGVDVSGRAALDAGASTGGFTDCLLQRGAAAVTAVDVGRAQLHEKLRADPRVTSLERTNIRHLHPADLPGAPFEVVVVDLSFISLRTVAPALVRLAAPGADLVVLVKPQFEAGRAEASRGRGVIRDPAVWAEALLGAIAALEDQGAAMMGVMVSPLRGADGNVEFLAHLVVGTGPAVPVPPTLAPLAERLDLPALLAEAGSPANAAGRGAVGPEDVGPDDVGPSAVAPGGLEPPADALGPDDVGRDDVGPSVVGPAGLEPPAGAAGPDALEPPAGAVGPEG